MAAKPMMRGLLKSQLKKDFAIASVISLAATLAWKFGVNNPRKAKYSEFYKTFDADKDFERMKNAGVFKCISPDGTINTDW